MRIEFRNISKPKFDYQTRYVAILPYITLVNERNPFTFSWWVYFGWLGYCIAIQIVEVPADVGKEIEDTTLSEN